MGGPKPGQKGGARERVVASAEVLISCFVHFEDWKVKAKPTFYFPIIAHFFFYLLFVFLL